MITNPPVFIMSSERSGSNLLRTLLSNHADISAPTAPHFLLFLHRLIPYYGPLSVRANAHNLFDDMLSIVNHANYQWNLKLDFEQVYSEFCPDSFMDFFDLFYQMEARRKGKSQFVCKENNLFDFAFPILDYYEKARFVYLYRDPRDYVASYLKAPLGLSTPFDAARRWKREQEKCAVLINAFCLEVYPVSYEDLVSDPSETMADILSFIGVSIDKACFEIVAGENESLAWNEYWQNLNRPVIKSNIKKYLQAFNTKTINLIESIVRDEMLMLGYSLDTSADWECTRSFKIRNFLVRRISRFWSESQATKTIEVMTSRKRLITSIKRKRKEEWRRKVNLEGDCKVAGSIH